MPVILKWVTSVSAGLTVIFKPVVDWMSSAVVVCVIVGASATELTVMVTVTMLPALTPPLAVPPSSFTR